MAATVRACGKSTRCGAATLCSSSARRTAAFDGIASDGGGVRAMEKMAKRGEVEQGDPSGPSLPYLFTAER